MNALISVYEYVFILPSVRIIFELFGDISNSNPLAEISIVLLDIFNLFPLIKNGWNVSIEAPWEDFSVSISRTLKDKYSWIRDSIKFTPIFRLGI